MPPAELHLASDRRSPALGAACGIAPLVLRVGGSAAPAFAIPRSRPPWAMGEGGHVQIAVPAAGGGEEAGAPRRRKTRQSVFLHGTWDTEDEFSCFIDYNTITEGSLRTILLEVYSEAQVARFKTTKQLVAAARRMKVHEERLCGSDALRYRAATVVSFLQRLEHVVPDARRALADVTLVRRSHWAIVARAGKASPIKVGSVVAGVDGDVTLLKSWDETLAMLTEVQRRPEQAPCTFRWAPFHSGYVEMTRVGDAAVERVACFLVLAYGVLAFFDREEPPRKRLGSMPLHDVAVKPLPSALGLGPRVELRSGAGVVLQCRPPPDEARYSPIVPLIGAASSTNPSHRRRSPRRPAPARARRISHSSPSWYFAWAQPEF